MNRRVLSEAKFMLGCVTSKSVGRNLHLAPPFLVYDYITKANLQLPEVLLQKLDMGNRELRSCRACPRNCDVNRLEDKRGVCNTGRNPIVRLKSSIFKIIFNFFVH